MSQRNSKRFGQAFTFKKKHAKPFKKKKDKGPTKSQIIDNEIKELKEMIDAGIDVSKISRFADFPLSKNTHEGLRKARYTTPTEIQKQAISLALQGKDVLGAAKTGSGKTLAFLIPVLELLHKLKTSSAFGMAALIITPTRELAFQIYEVLNKIRSAHDFTANLVIGGKKMWREEQLMAHTNIVICTVGRLLHHLDHTPTFSADDLKILVLDEADRIMDSKFAQDMDNILSHLPSQRQTLMFSATQTKSVKALARLSLKDPSYVSVHEHAQHATPSRLEQSYIVCELHQKLSMLYSFLKNHPNNKIIVFLQTCKQVRYVHTVMKRERPGMSVLALYGGLNQLRRIDIYKEFCRKKHVILLATDIACRGLDFPAVNWVVQLDSPVDVDTYIHRAGRTARFEDKGQALLVLMPSEEDRMVEALQQRRIPIKKISVNMNKVQDISGSVSSACASSAETKNMAERAFKTYVYSLHIMKKNLVSKLDLEKFAQSLGLFLTPKLRFLKEKRSSSADFGKTVESSSVDMEDKMDEGDEEAMLLKPRTGGQNKVEEQAGESEEEGEGERRAKSKKSKAALAKKLLKKNITVNTVIHFDEEGAPIKDAYKRRHTEDDDDDDDEGGINIESASKRLRLEDSIDRKIEKERVKQKHREERIKKKERKRAAQQQKRAEEEEEEGALLEGGEEDDPLQYIPDPDTLATRGSDDSSHEVNSHDENDAEDSDDDENEDEDSDDDENNDDSDEEENVEEGDNRRHHRSLEATAMELLQRARLKK